MGSSGLLQAIKANPLALAASVVLHVVLIVLLSMNLVSSEVHTPKRAPQKTMEAVVVDASAVDREVEKLRQQEKAKQKKLQQEKQRVQKEIAAEKKRLAELKKKQAAEKKRKAELKKKQAAEKQKKLEAEKRRKAELARKQEEKRKAEAAERKRKAEAERKRQAEAERKRKEAERQKQLAEEAERKRKAEEERLEREAREAAARQTLLDRLRLQYVDRIKNHVEMAWTRPFGVKTSECEVLVTQNTQGFVLNVELQNCKGETSYLSSIKKAVKRAEPLPQAPDPDVFEKEILFTFRPPLF